ncbi:MAG TPA: acyl-CoA dehydrogenase [Alphaproteobacteria bacterium]|jgi:alkylation response protein AidB-like acyl-CoA dehydrogenase|nr:acyl-CoA dehydrogenase [Alphaproteobacteria bacterium]HBA41878.1 acyl-CoA dehydrogenase [Alphaproteobacteria bacterium]HBF96987.1 acyl-CoA dehydrogenase [Alphaproteobacteria bacterium]HCO90177.1 acyl-CoA dehydrogenase [Alphaproteobacteria bacterium]
MALVLNEDQQQLKDAAHAFIQDKSPVSALRKLRDEENPDGFDRALWAEMVELGWPGIIIPEEFGGSEFGYTGLGVVLQEMGRTLTASPMVSTVLIGASAYMLGASDVRKKAMLPEIAAGKKIVALALEEGPRHAPYNIATRGGPSVDGYRISGEKTFVLDGQVADELIVVARESGEPGDRDGLTLFLVDAKAPGVKITPTRMADSRNAANITFNGASASGDKIIGEKKKGADVLDAILDRARIGLAAEMLGAIEVAFEMTVEYLKTRQQFGRPIGSFQGLAHRAAEMFCEVELSKSVVLDALSAIDDNRDDIAQAASLAKARLNDTFHLISCEMLQMHGGIGMTDEADIGFYMKRARVAAATFGDSAFHRDRYATLEGY